MRDETIVTVIHKVEDTGVQRRLWEESERLTGVGYVLDPARP